jgi:hypothetical protein
MTTDPTTRSFPMPRTRRALRSLSTVAALAIQLWVAWVALHAGGPIGLPVHGDVARTAVFQALETPSENAHSTEPSKIVVQKLAAQTA